MSHTTKARLVLDVEYRGIEKDFNKIFEPIKYKYVGRLVKSLNVTVQESQTTEHPAVPDLKLQELNQHKRIAKKILELAGYNTLRGKAFDAKYIELHQSVSPKTYRARNTDGAFDQATRMSEDKLAKIIGSKSSHQIMAAAEGPEMFLHLHSFPMYSNVTYVNFPWRTNLAPEAIYITQDMKFDIHQEFGMTIRDTTVTLWKNMGHRDYPNDFTEIASIDMHNPNSFQTMADSINAEMEKSVQTKLRIRK